MCEALSGQRELEHLYSVSKVAEFRLLEAEYLGLARKGY